MAFIARGRNIADIRVGLFGIALGLSREITHFLNTVRAAYLVIHDTDRERNQWELIGTPFTVYTAYGSTPQIFRTIERGTAFFIPARDMLTEERGAARGSDHDKVVTANMPNKILAIAIFVDHTLTGTPY